jgi:polyphosphate glucokinase
MSEGILGIDIGGSGIKGAPVDTHQGTLLAERFRLETPQPATPEATVETVAAVARQFDWTGPIGVGFPAVVKNGVIHTAANIDSTWIGRDAAQMIAEATDSPTVHVANDADVAGLAEIQFGAGRDVPGLVLMITLGTGIGTALFLDGKLIPNMELGHIEIKGKDAESWAAESARDREELKWGEWAKRVDRYLRTMEALLWPDLIIVGGGVSRKAERFFPDLTTRTRVVPATLLNEAGIIGAALNASVR